jgi:hypothetical protein
VLKRISKTPTPTRTCREPPRLTLHPRPRRREMATAGSSAEPRAISILRRPAPEAKRNDQGCGLQWRENMKPHGGGNQAEGKAGQPRHQRHSKSRREKIAMLRTLSSIDSPPPLGQRFCSRWFKADLCGPNFFRLRQSSEILCDRLELFDRARAARAPKGRLSLRDSSQYGRGSMSSWLAQWPSLDRLQLLGDVEAWPLRLDHIDDAAQVTFGAPQAPDDLGMALWIGWPFTGRYPIHPDGICSSRNFAKCRTASTERSRSRSGEAHSPPSRADAIPVHILA